MSGLQAYMYVGVEGGKEWWEIEYLHIYFSREEGRKIIQNSNENTGNLKASCLSSCFRNSAVFQTQMH